MLKNLFEEISFLKIKFLIQIDSRLLNLPDSKNFHSKVYLSTIIVSCTGGEV